MRHDLKVFALLVSVAGMAAFASGAAWASEFNGSRNDKGGYVLPCSLDGVNPAVHPDIFGNAAAARSYGFYLGSDHAWHVLPGCHR